MTEPDIYAILSEIFEDVFMRPIALRPDLAAQDVEDWDSFKQIDIILAVEERFSIKAGTRDVDHLHAVGDLVRMIAAKTAGA